MNAWRTRRSLWVALGVIATFACVAAVIGYAWVLWRLDLNESGYCEETGTYNDKDTIIRLAVANELQNMKAYGVQSDGKTLEQIKSSGQPLKHIAVPAYEDLADFFQHNPLHECCKLDPDLYEGTRIGISLANKLEGYHHGLYIKWASPYLEESGKKVFTYRGDQPSELLLYAFNGGTSYQGFILMVNNCGDTRVAWDEFGIWGGR